MRQGLSPVVAGRGRTHDGRDQALKVFRAGAAGQEMGMDAGETRGSLGARCDEIGVDVEHFGGGVASGIPRIRVQEVAKTIPVVPG